MERTRNAQGLPNFTTNPDTYKAMSAAFASGASFCCAAAGCTAPAARPLPLYAVNDAARCWGTLCTEHLQQFCRNVQQVCALLVRELTGREPGDT